MESIEPQESGKSNLLPILLTAIVSAVIFGGLGYYLGNGRSATTSIVSPGYTMTKTSYTSPTSSATTMSTSTSTKTYTNTNYGFSFKYPSTLTLVDHSTATHDPMVLLNDATSRSLDAYLAVNIYGSVKELDAAYDKLGATTLTDFLSKNSTSDTGYIEPAKPITIGGKAGYIAMVKSGSGSSGTNRYVELSDGTILVINVAEPDTSVRATKIEISSFVDSFTFTK